jgi:hypothetical protein
MIPLFVFILKGLYLHKVTETKLLVDTSRGQSLRINVQFLFFFFMYLIPFLFILKKKFFVMMNIYIYMQFDVTFPAIRCSLLSVDAIDISGEQHLDIVCTPNK